MPAKIDYSFQQGDMVCTATCRGCQLQYLTTKNHNNKSEGRCPRCCLKQSDMRMLCLFIKGTAPALESALCQ